MYTKITKLKYYLDTLLYIYISSCKYKKKIINITYFNRLFISLFISII